MSTRFFPFLFGMATLVGFVALHFLSVRDVRSNGGGGDAGLARHLFRMSRTINAGLPLMVDGATRLETTFSGPGAAFSYVYTLAGARSGEISAEGVRSAFAPTLKHNFCREPEMRPFISANVSLVFIYLGNEGREITRIRISPSDCAALGKRPIIFSA